MKILFITPQYVKQGQYYDFYFGLAYVSAYVKKCGFKIHCINSNHSKLSIEKILTYYNDIDIICTGGMSFHYHKINEVLDAAKKINPNIITIAGGAIVTSDPTLAMNNMQIDYGVIGEGEITTANLLTALQNSEDISKVKGIIYKVGNKSVITESAPYIENLNVLPMPDYEGFQYGEYIKLIRPSQSYYTTVFDKVRPAHISTSRSCPYGCTFCYHPLGNKYRQRSLDNVFEEIEFLIKTYNINFINVLDELFSFNKERMYEFAARIKKYHIKWSPQLRVDEIDEDVLNTLKDSGAYIISYGIESASNTILKSMKKHITIEQVENALTLTRKAGIGVIGNILIGDPADTEETVAESITWWRTHPKFGINLSMIRTIPDSPIYQYALKEGIIKDKLKHIESDFPIVNLTKISDNKFFEIQAKVYTQLVDKNYQIFGEIIESIITHCTSQNEKVYSIKVKCPDCGEISTYKNMTQNSFNMFLMVICRHCFLRVMTKNKKAFPENYTFSKTISSYIIILGYRTMRKYKFLGILYYRIMSPLIRSNSKLYSKFKNYR